MRARRERFLAGRRAKTDVSLHRFEIVKVNYHGRFLASEERKKKRGKKESRDNSSKGIRSVKKGLSLSLRE